ncbi:NAD-dependent succinate-semialdehyde dehydrogenase [Methanococcoides alaskense]|uniref:Succinate-semialdehyde dehydrogenase/glutarate-semialdehyde dehydrogenase n=1 Tax=Methanococcoides alaskense TaxID=325778 RepID=A0AA90TYB1_9EURY|nr:NAD-dependent succinate-semialdehyde dehydrogenase [Methanococcoides alaskense]MDA0525564.1 NAD-dependent succinate-semialdehyde dehydrogenase [Methanococcoides alaskense]MDR6222345.1 succinate-semialdehyde dehydrogenase/glutarate-semialdehyde dehydrogenase [Methanococcoides alaskense]
MKKITSINPANGTVNGEFEFHSPDKVDLILKRSSEAFQYWRSLKGAERAVYLENVAKVLRNDKQELAEAITMEMGKPIRQALAEVEKCASMFDHFAANICSFLEPDVIKESPSAFISYEPMGVVLAIKPWNFPLWQVLSAASHILAGGNTMVLKHSGYVPMCALKIESVFEKAGFPEGVFQTLLVDGPTASSLISRPEIAAVSFTGGLPAGQKVAEVAGRNMKKCVLELGGSDPFIVLEDADIEEAAKAGVAGRFLNSGQTCISSKRFIIESSVVDEFTSAFVENTRKLKMGDPLDRGTDLGPLVRDGQVSLLEGQIENAVSMGAKVELEGGRVEGDGYYFSPVVLSNVSLDMKVMKEETFGPVAPIISVEDELEALKVANATEFGLGASIWSSDKENASFLACQIESGVVGVNGFFKPEADLPFGGVKKSGIGRELSRFGFYEFMNIRSTVLF